MVMDFSGAEMPRKWWLVVIVLAIALLVAGWGEKRCQDQAYQCRATYEAQSQSERIAVPLTVGQQASEQQAIAAACEPNGYFCRLLSAANLPTVILVFIGIGGVWAALRTLNAIRMEFVATHRPRIRVRENYAERLAKNHRFVGRDNECRG